MGKYIKEMQIKITCSKDKYLTAGFEYYPVNTIFEELKSSNRNDSRSHHHFAKEYNITGIKNISILVGSGAEVEVESIIIKKQKNSTALADQYFEQGNEYFRHGNYEQAINPNCPLAKFPIFDSSTEFVNPVSSINVQGQLNNSFIFVIFNNGRYCQHFMPQSFQPVSYIPSDDDLFKQTKKVISNAH
jgi:hypothetical protein